MTLGECLRQFGTGGLRRLNSDQPFGDVIVSGRTSRLERGIAGHPSLKPQSFLRQIVRASLPLGSGTILDPFMGSGSTIAAAEAVGLNSIGLERYQSYYELAKCAVPQLSQLALADEDRQLPLLEVHES